MGEQPPCHVHAAKTMSISPLVEAASSPTWQRAPNGHVFWHHNRLWRWLSVVHSLRDAGNSGGHWPGQDDRCSKAYCASTQLRFERQQRPWDRLLRSKKAPLAHLLVRRQTDTTIPHSASWRKRARALALSCAFMFIPLSLGQFHGARHDLPLTHRTAPHRTTPHHAAGSLSLLLSALAAPCHSPPAAVCARTAALVRRAPDPSGAEPQREHSTSKQSLAIRTRLHCETFAPSTPPIRLDSPLRSPPRAEHRVEHELGRPSTPASPAHCTLYTVHCTNNRRYPPPQPQPSQCATTPALGPPALPLAAEVL